MHHRRSSYFPIVKLRGKFPMRDNTAVGVDEIEQVDEGILPIQPFHMDAAMLLSDAATLACKR